MWTGTQRKLAKLKVIAFVVSAKQERLLRRRAPRNPPVNLEASQSATVSSTSSSPECNAATVKRVRAQSLLG